MQQTKNTAAAPTQLNQEEIDAVIKQAFGRPAASVVFSAKAGADVLGWCAAVFRGIADEAGKERPSQSQISKLAEVGQFLGSFHCESIGYECEDMVDNLDAAKVYAEGTA